MAREGQLGLGKLRPTDQKHELRGRRNSMVKDPEAGKELGT